MRHETESNLLRQSVMNRTRRSLLTGQEKSDFSLTRRTKCSTSRTPLRSPKHRVSVPPDRPCDPTHHAWPACELTLSIVARCDRTFHACQVKNASHRWNDVLFFRAAKKTPVPATRPVPVGTTGLARMGRGVLREHAAERRVSRIRVREEDEGRCVN